MYTKVEDELYEWFDNSKKKRMFSFHHFKSELNRRTEAQDQDDSGIHLSLHLTFFFLPFSINVSRKK